MTLPRSPLALLLLALPLGAALADTAPAPTPPPSTPATSPAPAAATPAPASTQPPVWTMPAGREAMRAVGESSHMEWPVYLPADAVASLRSFQLAFQAAIDVMPEASMASLSLNGQFVGRVPIAAPRGTVVQAVDIPPGLLVPGWNAVSLDVTQTHRVDCSLASTYELWTQFDPTRTGFRGSVPRIGTMADLSSLPTDADGATPLHLVVPKGASPADLGRAVRVVEQLAIRARYLHPAVDTVPSPKGLNVAVGSADFLASLPGVGKPLQPAELKKAADGGLWLTVAGREGDADLPADTFGPAVAQGSDEGLKVLARRAGLRLRPGDSLTLADLGFKSQGFAGRLLHASFDVELPPDSFPADYAEAKLAIDGGYAAGLLPESRLLVRVNGVIDGSLDLDRGGGAVLQSRVVNMPLAPFRPGRNHVEIEAQLPARADATCDTLNSIGAKERLLILGTSTLSLPPLARVARFPSLSAAITGGLRITPDVPPRLYVPRITDASLSAVGTLLSNAAVIAGAPTGVVLQRGSPPEEGGPAIVVGEASDIPAGLIDAVGVDSQSVSTAWRAGNRVVAGDAFPRPATGMSDTSRLDVWGERVETQGSWLGRPGSVIGAAGEHFTASLKSAGLLGRGERPLEATADTTFIVAQGFNGASPLTVVTGRDGAALANGMRSLTSPARLSSLSGRAATLEGDTDGATIVPARDMAFFRTQPFSLTNDRLVAAGWVSMNASWYLGAVLVAVSLLGALTWLRLRLGRGGEHP